MKYLSAQTSGHLHWPGLLRTYEIHPYKHVRRHTETHRETHTDAAELYGRSGYKYLSILLHLIFILSSRAHIRVAGRRWGNPEEGGRRERTSWQSEIKKTKKNRAGRGKKLITKQACKYKSRWGQWQGSWRRPERETKRKMKVKKGQDVVKGKKYKLILLLCGYCLQ